MNLSNVPFLLLTSECLRSRLAWNLYRRCSLVWAQLVLELLKTYLLLLFFRMGEISLAKWISWPYVLLKALVMNGDRQSTTRCPWYRSTKTIWWRSDPVIAIKRGRSVRQVRVLTHLVYEPFFLMWRLGYLGCKEAGKPVIFRAQRKRERNCELPWKTCREVRRQRLIPIRLCKSCVCRCLLVRLSDDLSWRTFEARVIRLNVCDLAIGWSSAPYFALVRLRIKLWIFEGGKDMHPIQFFFNSCLSGRKKKKRKAHRRFCSWGASRHKFAHFPSVW